MEAFGKGMLKSSAKALTQGGIAAFLALAPVGCMPDRFSGPSLQAPRQTALPSGEQQPIDEGIDPAERSGPIESRPLDPPDMGQSGQQIASNQTFDAPPARRPSQSTATGAWRAQDASGASCRVVLASSPALDLYKASTSGCANRDLAAVNAWQLQDGEVFLYARGGGVVARLRDNGGSFSGALTKSGAPLTLTR